MENLNINREKSAAKNAKCKECHKIGHFYKVCQSKKKTTKANLAQIAPQAEQDTYYNSQAKQNTYYNDFTGFGLSNTNPHNQPNLPMVNMLRITNHIGTTSGSQGNHLKFPIDVDPRGSYKNHLIVRVDTGTDVNCMNEKTFRRLFPKVKLSVCPHEIQNFGNSTADISILGQFHTYLQFRGEKYLSTLCMDDHFTQTTEGTQQQYLQDISHAEIPSGMENTPSFPGKQFLQGKEGFTLLDMEKMPVFLGKQFLQGKEKNMDTGTFTLGNIILNRHPALSTLTHPGRVQQNFQQLKMESSIMVALPCFNFNAEATTQMETSKKRPGADSIHNGKDIPVTSSQVTPIGPKDSIQLPARTSTHTLMSVHSQDSHSSKTDQLKKSKVQGNRLTRFSHHFDTDSTCDQKSLPRDLHKYWNDREILSINLKKDTNMNTNYMTTIPMAHKEVYLLPRPLKAMTHQYRHPEKEVHLLSGPSELQPVDDGVTQYTPKGKDQDLLQPPDASEAQKPNTDPATKTRIQPIHRKRKS